ncbi:MAG: hypothetical protein EPO22_10520 [Dehalococcoidia bacterium]|nr:MAG: hypothetical protein EPO22_10520 [Dehalococcoidia bacterium]
MLRLLFLLPVLVVVVPALLLGLGVLLAVAGSPGKCGGGRDLTFDPQLASDYEQRWLELNAQLTTGRPASFTVSDSEATSQSRLFLAEAGAPIRDVRVCFVTGAADANGTISPPIGPDIAVRVNGSVDLSGQHPRASIDSIRVGGLPGFIARPFLGPIERLIDDQAEQIVLDHRISVQLSDGQAVISGQP